MSLCQTPPPQKPPFYYTIFFYDIAQHLKNIFKTIAHYFRFIRVGLGRFQNFSIFGVACRACTKWPNSGFCRFLSIFLHNLHESAIPKMPNFQDFSTCRAWLGCDTDRKNEKSPNISLNTQKLS